MPIYENGIIYKLKHTEDYDDLNIYIGSTTNFRCRKNQHKTCCNNENTKKYTYKVYEYIRDNGGWEQWVMIPIEQYSCDNKKELEIKERYYIDLLQPTLNNKIPTRTNKEYREDNKEKIKEVKKEYYEDNKEKIKEIKKEYYEDNKEKIKEREKGYYENNKEKIKEREKRYKENNKEKIKENKKEKFICDHCGCKTRKYGLKRHQKTRKCLNINNIS